MRVVVDAVPLLVRSAGVKNYLYYWIEHLRRQAGRDSIVTFPRMDPLPPLNHEGSVLGRAATFATLARLALGNRTPLPVLDWAASGAQVFHASSLVWHPPRRCRLTATIHDMTSWLMPELHARGNRLADEHFAGIARRASGLIAVSACTRDDAARVLKLDASKITVIHSGVAAAFFGPPAAAVDSVRERYRLHKPFVLFTGTIEPRKNLDTLFNAFEQLPASTREAHDLVLAGPVGWAAESTRARLARCRYLGYVPEADLAPLTAAATVFAYPSLYEGFGFPVVQAMAAGVPVITSNVSSLPEIAGDAAMLVDPRSVSELCSGLDRLLGSASLRTQLAAAGRKRARAFHWDECARKSLVFFREIA